MSGRLVGYVRDHDVKTLPDKAWGSHPLSEIVRPCSPDNTVPPELDSLRALAQMRRTGNSRLMVAEQGHLVGVVALAAGRLEDGAAMADDEEVRHAWSRCTVRADA